MKKTYYILVTLTIGTLLTNTALADLVVKIRPQKPKIVIVKPDKPGKDHFWKSGHWVIKKNRYVWVDGYWIKKRPNHIWINGHWKKVRHGWIWVPGHFVILKRK